MARNRRTEPSDRTHASGWLRVDLHAHTHFSWDGVMSPETIVRRAQEVGLDRVAVTDHDQIEGALRSRDLAPDLIIVGEEIRCACGSELIGLFIEEYIPPRLPAQEVAQRIHEQGGLVYAPHPFAYMTRAEERAERVLAVADVCEVFNSRAFIDSWNARSRARAAELGLPCAASSDAHMAHEIGRAFTLVPPFDGAAELLTALCSGVPHVKRKGTVLSHVVTLTRGLARLGAGAFTDANDFSRGRGVGSRQGSRETLSSNNSTSQQ